MKLSNFCYSIIYHTNCTNFRSLIRLKFVVGLCCLPNSLLSYLWMTLTASVPISRAYETLNVALIDPTRSPKLDVMLLFCSLSPTHVPRNHRSLSHFSSFSLAATNRLVCCPTGLVPAAEKIICCPKRDEPNPCCLKNPLYHRKINSLSPGGPLLP